jgi:hypothetical protein
VGSVEAKIRRIGWAIAAAALMLCPDVSRADQGGASFWLPGTYGSLVAVPQTPGWSLSVVYYHYNVAASGNVAASKEILTDRLPPTVKVNLNLGLSGQADLVTLAPTYTFVSPVLGGQLAVTMSSQYGRNAASIAGTLTALAGPIVKTRTGMLEDSLTSYGDLVPNAELLWNVGPANYMAYVTGDIPVGDYNPMRLANIGLGHGAIDAGGAYTYLNAATGNEFSGVIGALPTISRIPTRNTEMASISTSTGVRRTTSRSSFSLALLDMPISKLPMIPVRIQFWAVLGRASSVSARRSDIFFRSEACRDFWD